MYTGRTKSALPTINALEPKKLSQKQRGYFNNLNWAKFGTKLLVLLIITSVFFLDYQPAFKFPPIKQNVTHAQTPEQSQTIIAQPAPFTFQLPHPGYMSTRYSTWHPGIDLATGLGMPIKPITQGIVIESGFNFWGLGLTVVIDHGQGYKSLYAHMGQIYVKNGQTVTGDNTLGTVGMTGNTSGPHTHLEVMKDGNRIDPTLILPDIRHQPIASDFTPATGGQIQIFAKQPTPTVKPSSTPKPTPTPTPPSFSIVPKNTPTLKTDRCKINVFQVLDQTNCR